MTPCTIFFILEDKMEENYDAFDDYVMQYDMNEDMIKYKYNHSYRVVHQAEEICRSLDLDNVKRDTASLIALLHDIARFKQWSEYKTFSDSKSFDHGDMGVKILFEDGLINKFNVNKEDYDIIKDAIKNHNKFKIDSKIKGDNLLQCKIIRDADKIDILYAFSTNRLLELEEDDKEITPSVAEAVLSHNQVLKKDIKSKNDRLLMLVSLIYDLNFDYSKERIKNEKYIDKIYGHLKHKKLFKEYFDTLNNYLKGENNG